MDFKIDENLPIEVARLFAEAGHSGSTAMEEGHDPNKLDTGVLWSLPPWSYPVLVDS